MSYRVEQGQKGQVYLNLMEILLPYLQRAVHIHVTLYNNKLTADRVHFHSLVQSIVTVLQVSSIYTAVDLQE